MHFYLYGYGVSLNPFRVLLVFFAAARGIRLDESPGSTPRDLQRSLTDLRP